MTGIVEWLESPKGEEWSRAKHYKANGNLDVLVGIKEPEFMRALIWYSFNPAVFIGLPGWEMLVSKR